MAKNTTFGSRLKQALKKTNISFSSPTKLATEFNLRHYGKPVSAQAVRKWLESESIPSVDKIITLSNWLGVSPAWLLFGENAGGDDTAADGCSDLCSNFQHLTPESQIVVRELILILLKRQKAK
jgi:transcriptional regulator with XRE-family HTH domain